ncbi:type IV pilus assembly protein PilM [Hydrogenispora ethanolica]|uniref:Type IV pilus assembly protein PilM n=1 Tax=Hydrogenispora ethanolica TaxID=1082276 RepID=A0A4R1RMD0_HYDET|nr:type IV pilus assembly protein PilM [Hydrogenispora ethanolica]TCL67431.1 type IV pilus assembly protein PilM [Hydrogenispora ethanolica]
MAKVGIGLDIGTSSVKIAELQGGKTVSLERFGIVPLEDGALAAGIVKDRAAVAGAIREVLAQSKIKHRKVVVAIASQAVIVRFFKLLKMADVSKEQLANAVRFEAENYIPFPIDEVTMDFQVVHTDPREGDVEVMLVCAQNEIIHSHLETLKEIGLQPLAMDIQPFAMMRAVGLEGDQPQSVALLDIGAGTSDLMIVKNQIPTFTRIIQLAGNRLTQSIGKNLGVNYDEAEKLKLTLSEALYDFTNNNPDSIGYKVNFAMQEGLKELVLELKRSFDYYQLQQRTEEVSRLLVSGGGSQINGMIPYLQNELGIDVQLAVPTSDIRYHEAIHAEFAADVAKMTVAVGLGLREVVNG